MVDMEMINRMVANCEAAIAKAEALLETDLSNKYVMGWEDTALFVQWPDGNTVKVCRVFEASTSKDICFSAILAHAGVVNGKGEYAKVMSMRRALEAEIRERKDVLEILRKDIIEKYNAEMEV